MSFEPVLFTVTALLLAGLPAVAVTRAKAIRTRPVWLRWLVALGIMILLAPPAMLGALILNFQVLGIDLID